MEKLQKRQGAIIVGIWGVHSGAGVTTLAVALANYMQGFLNKKTALYEFNSKNDFAKIYESAYGEYSKIDEGKFQFMKVEYFMKDSTDMWKLCNDIYDVIIVDFGNNWSAINELAKCHHKIILSSLEPWYCKKYEAFCEILPEYQGSDVWLHVIGSDEREIKRIKRAYKVTATKRPYIENPYIIDKNLLHFFSYLFE